MNHTKSTLLGRYFRGALMGAADIVPGVSGGTIALITGIYQELVESIDNLHPKHLKVLLQEGISAFWKAVNGPFLAPVFLGVISSIFLLSSSIDYLIQHHPIPLWAFFFGMIFSSIFFLLRQFSFRPYHLLHILIGSAIAYGITQLTPTATSVSLPYLFFCSSIAIMAMILPGISGAFIFILLGVYDDIIFTVKSALPALLSFQWEQIYPVYIKIITIVLGIITGLKLFSKLLKWLFSKRKDSTLAVLVGFMAGALPKIWPWKSMGPNAVEVNVNPFVYSGDAQLGLSILLLVGGFFFIFWMERSSQNLQNGNTKT